MRCSRPRPVRATVAGRRSRARRPRSAVRPAVDQLAVGAAAQAGDGELELRVAHLAPTPARNVIAILPGSDPARAGEYVLVGAHNDHVGINATRGRPRLAARRQHRDAPPGRERSGVPSDRRPAAPHRLAHRARAQHSRAAPRLDHERRRRRRLGHGRCCSRSPSGSRARSRRARSSSSRTRAKRRACSARVVRRPSDDSARRRSSPRTTWTWSARDASTR